MATASPLPNSGAAPRRWSSVDVLPLDGRNILRRVAWHISPKNAANIARCDSPDLHKAARLVFAVLNLYSVIEGN